MTLRELIDHRPVVFDGAMGTQIQGLDLKASDFGGKEGANDLLTLTRPDLVEAIHGRYFAAGCDVVETNTFGSSRLKLDEYGLGHRTYEVNFRAAILARRAAEPVRHARAARASWPARWARPACCPPRPTRRSPTSPATRWSGSSWSRRAALIEGGVDAIIIETQQDILELRAAVLGADAARREAMRDVFLIAQPTLIDAERPHAARHRHRRGAGHAGAAAGRRGRPQLLHRPRRDARERCARWPSTRATSSR